jgi:hypothetical protein
MATLAIGLLAAAIADSCFRSGGFTRLHVPLAVVGVVAIFLMAGRYRDVLGGVAPPATARHVSNNLVLVVALIGCATQFNNAIGKDRTRRPKTRHTTTQSKQPNQRAPEHVTRS